MFTTQVASSWRPDQNALTFFRELDTRRLVTRVVDSVLTRLAEYWLLRSLLGAVILAAACRSAPVGPPPTPAPAEAPVQAAERATQCWLALLDHAQYESSWDSAATSMQRAVTRAGWRSTVQQARIAYEPFGARRLVSAQYATSLPGAPTGEYVVLQYATQTAGGRTVIETVVPMLEAGRWRVSGYFVRPQ